MTSIAKTQGSSAVRKIQSLRNDFPTLNQDVNNKPLVYLDSAASAQSPQIVIDAMSDQKKRNHSNVHRGVHKLSQRSTEAYEGARTKIKDFINAESEDEIIFTRGTTESINLVASSLGNSILTPNDEVLITWMEHHSNLVPWQLICNQTGANLRVVPINNRGELELEEYKKLLSNKTKIVAIGHVSNALGTINPIEHIIETAHHFGALVVIDGAQSIPHLKLDVSTLDCDFYAFSGHKMYGPSGVGVLFGKKSLLNSMPPYQGGGGMINEVNKEGITYGELPNKYEAGTMATAQVIAFNESIKFLENLGIKNIEKHENEIIKYGEEILRKNNSVKLIGNPKNRGGVLSFNIDGIHPHDIATILDEDGVAIRAGHHCCQILHKKLNLTASARASVGVYNTKEDFEKLNESINKCKKIFDI